jgi:S-DNA-T family DNA segregation ATPase FtsK/SpoIIIE
MTATSSGTETSPAPAAAPHEEPVPPAAEPALVGRQRTALRSLRRLAGERTTTGPEIERAYRARVEAAEREYEEDFQTAIVRFASAKEAADNACRERREEVEARYAEEKRAAEEEVDAGRRRVLAVYERDRHEAKTALKEAAWTAGAVLEGARGEAESQYQEAKQRAAAQMQQLRATQGEALALLERWGQHPEEVEAAAAATQAADGKYRKLPDCLTAAQQQLEDLSALWLPRLARGGRLGWLFVLLALALVYPAYLFGKAQFDTTFWYGPAASTAVVALLGVVVVYLVKASARARVEELYQPLSQAVADAEVSFAHIAEYYAARRKRQVAEAKERYRAEIRRLQRAYRKRRHAGKKQRNEGLKLVREHFRLRVADNERRHEDGLRETEEHHKLRLAAVQERWQTESRSVEERRQRLLEEVKARHDADRRELAETWERGLAEVETAVREVNAEAARLFPPWDDPAWQGWAPPSDLPPAVRLGDYQVGLEQFATKVPRDELQAPASLLDFTLPALVGFPGQCSLLLEASDAGRARAVEALQAVMFRLLTTLPPGKVRFTILDPVGLGQNFAAFMHLADHDEALVTSRIWTEASHIEHRLADLTAHMETVIQKYLRNQFRTIAEYNAHAGEVAEPFRVLVVANFPANFSTDAARRLVSIAQSGPRCGVHTLISVDTKQPLPQGFDLADLEATGATLLWTADGAEGNGAAREPRFVWRDEDFGPFALHLDSPPPDAQGLRLLTAVGEQARVAKRVEVPFEFIAPQEAEWWTCDSRLGLDVPLGRAGATKRQHLRLGAGTSQHVLVAGKTGSGKSTLLHALITNLALLYSPDEAELYLVDFKKGVEFKTYATHELPHARVVAIESEREFGLSVLQRLDAELKQRGELFRNGGAQNLAAYRDETGNKLPRILLIVDEFQEFFVEDDRIAQDAAQLLDRLVRQGRAFGLHVLLGSQTLGGAYTLARSTIDQMAVRIALQCSEADAHLILSDENSAARLLSRPGEAIYNDANGLVEGNNPFQVVWLDDDRREDYLQRVHDLVAERRPLPKPPQLVFEGNVAADPGKNHLLEDLLRAPAWPAVPPRAVHAWLGEPMTIKEPTSATFRPQSASNLLVVGQQDDAALATLVLSLVSLAAQLPPGPEPSLYVLDGSPVDAPYAGYLEKLPAALPQAVRLGGWRDVPAVLDEVSAELDRRQKTPDTQFAPLFFVAFGLQRFRDLRRSEDDFGFGRREEKPTPAQQFATLLREGPGLGLHTLLWCDTLNNLNRSLDRASLREFDLRILFQMSVADSSNLIDSPLAAKLGLHRAYFYSEEQGRLEKFRPYGLPADAWLAQVGERLRSRQPFGTTS